jgi:hypothetical protein
MRKQWICDREKRLTGIISMLVYFDEPCSLENFIAIATTIITMTLSTISGKESPRN